MQEFDTLAEALLGLKEDDKPYDLDELLAEQYGIGFEEFNHLITDLLPFCVPMASPWEGATRHMLGVASEDGQGWTALAVLDLKALRMEKNSA